MGVWTVPMLLAGALFTGGVTWFAWMRLPAWRAMSPADFEADFAGSIRRADRVQPALLAATLVSTIGFAAQATDAARTLAIAGIAGLALIMVGSGAFLVPLQRRMIKTAGGGIGRTNAARRWSAGHLVRTALALASFTLLVVAASS
jgi:hypothetical protein